MAALLLSVAGAAVGGAVFGPVGAIAGRIVGAIAGNVIDHALLAPNTSRQVEGPRLADLDVMASTEGAPIPRLYGRARLSGEVIWATRLEEVVSTSSEKSGGKGGGGSQTTTTTTTYSYFANFAVGLCEGEIGRVARIWADGKLLDLNGVNYRVYAGNETQDPDALIVAKEGAEQAPAYRGLAYVVFERMALENFGNRIPQLAFEVTRPLGRLEPMIRAVTLIPGTTEFGYETATIVQVVGPGQFAPENRHVAHALSDVEVSLDDLQAVCPNLERVALVVAWFGTDLRAGNCQVRPGVETLGKTTYPATWSVAGIGRASAHLVSQIGGRPAFGSTPDDASVLHLIAELKARGLKITLHPFLMMDIPSGNILTDPYTGAGTQPLYPWRGRITCSPAPGQAGSPDGTSGATAQINAFFGVGDPTGWNFRRMILHYASLAASAGGVDAFMIGSELKALTRVRSAAGVYPAVTRLAELAADVRAIVGGGTIVTYGADWTEYGSHVVTEDASEVRFPLDALWASSAIDVVGIDYYAPLADWRDGATHLDRALANSTHEVGYLAGNLRAGEGYDFYYADDAARIAQDRSTITDGLGKPWVFRAKDLWNWWSNTHYERVGGTELSSPTGWVAQGKPIWLAEIGCPAVDKGANQPSTFPDPKSSDGGLPHFSNGRRDDLIQRRFLQAVLGTFDPDQGATLTNNPVSTVYGERMIEPSAIQLWAWDARPYPVFPAAIDVWSDGPNWETGHWLTGRLGSAPLDALVAAILTDAGIDDVVTADLKETVDGYVIDRPMPPRAAIEPLALAYAFDAAEVEGILAFRPRGGEPVAEIVEDELVLPEDRAPARLTRAQETELPREVSISFTDAGSDYRRSAVTSRRLVGGATRVSQANLAVVTYDTAAERRADIWLQDLWAGRESADFALPPSRLAFAPGDVIGLTVGGRRRIIELRAIVDAGARAVTAQTIDPGVFDVPLAAPRRIPPPPPVAVGPAQALLLDLPTLTADEPPVLARLAVFANPWPGPISIGSSFDGVSYQPIALVLAPAVIGVTLDDLAAGPASRWDWASSTRVRLYGGALVSVTDTQVLNGANAAAVQRSDGAWEVLQFANADLVGERTYRLSRFLRGQMGSEWAMAAPLPAGAPFVLLNQQITPIARGIETLGHTMQLRVVAAGRSYGDQAAVALSATPQSTALKPLAPVRLAAARDGTGVTFSWIRRKRGPVPASWDVTVPLGEDSEAYEIDVLSGSAVVRTLHAGAPNVLYTAAAEAADFGSAQSTLAIRVYQMSATVGRGFPVSATLTP
jgi:GTA TIM-barrel-like domain/Putative phage tail protein